MLGGTVPHRTKTSYVSLFFVAMMRFGSLSQRVAIWIGTDLGCRQTLGNSPQHHHILFAPSEVSGNFAVILGNLRFGGGDAGSGVAIGTYRTYRMLASVDEPQDTRAACARLLPD